MCVISKPKPIMVPQPVQQSKPAAPPTTPASPAVAKAGERERKRLQSMSGQSSTIVTSAKGLLNAPTTGKIQLGG